MFEEGDEAAAIKMVALLDRQRAGDLLVPAFMIDEARVLPDLAKLAGGDTLVGNEGGAVGDRIIL